jgi:hypothetical protein
MISGERTRLARCDWRPRQSPGEIALRLQLPTRQEDFGEGAENGTRGARAPQTFRRCLEAATPCALI